MQLKLNISQHLKFIKRIGVDIMEMMQLGCVYLQDVYITGQKNRFHKK